LELLNKDYLAHKHLLLLPLLVGLVHLRLLPHLVHHRLGRLLHLYLVLQRLRLAASVLGASVHLHQLLPQPLAGLEASEALGLQLLLQHLPLVLVVWVASVALVPRLRPPPPLHQQASSASQQAALVALDSRHKPSPLLPAQAIRGMLPPRVGPRI
jgi:hypothetical protein